jgi:tetratricopeptide (TPR) repeat protein
MQNIHDHPMWLRLVNAFAGFGFGGFIGFSLGFSIMFLVTPPADRSVLFGLGWWLAALVGFVLGATGAGVGLWSSLYWIYKRKISLFRVYSVFLSLVAAAGLGMMWTIWAGYYAGVAAREQFNQGLEARQAKRYDAAIVRFDQAAYFNIFTISPTTVSENYNLGEIYLERGIVRYEQGDYRRAIADFDRSIQAYGRGIFRSMKGVVYDPPNRVYYYRGFARHKLGKLSEALSDFNRAIQADPKSPWMAAVYFQRGEIHRVTGNTQKAINDFRMAATLYQQSQDPANVKRSQQKLQALK